MVYIPKNVPRNREELLAYSALKKGSSPEQRQTEELPSTKDHYEEAMAELHNTPEIQLLDWSYFNKRSWTTVPSWKSLSHLTP